MYYLVVELLRPHLLLTVLAGYLVSSLWRHRRRIRARLVALTAVLSGLALVSSPAVVHLALLTLEGGYPSDEGRPAPAEAIVVFAAGLYPPGGRRIRAEMDEDSLRRCLHAAELYAAGAPCLVVVSGGKVDPEQEGPSCAAVMGVLLGQLGVKAANLIVEQQSRSTYENAVESARILRERGIRRVVLAVDAADMPRAAACLRRQGIEVLPSPCHFRAIGFPTCVLDYLPTAHGAIAFDRVWHEWLGIAWYWFQGRI